MSPLLEGWAPPARPSQLRPPGAGVTQLELCGEITVEAAIPLFRAIEAARDDTIEISIASGGGNALCALALFELLALHPCCVVATIERASSGAVLVALGADVRRVTAGARIMVHGTRASLQDATPDVLRATLADLDQVDAMSVAILADATGQPPERVAAWRRSATTFSAPRAVAFGFAHEIAAH